MALQQASLGVDIGTTGCRSVVYSDQAILITSSEKFYPTQSPKPGWAEQDPEEVLTQVEKSIQEAVVQARNQGYVVSMISFSAVNHAVIPMHDGQPLGPCIIWADNRSTEITEGWKREGLADTFYHHTGCPIHPMYLPGKLKWLFDYQPEVFKAADHFISLKELLFLRWFGSYVSDASIANSSGLFNVHRFDWDEEILERVHVKQSQLSEIVPTMEVFQLTNPEVRKRLGLSENVQVVIGAGDGVLSSLGAGAIEPGEVTVMIGTSGAARITVDQPTFDEKGRTWCYHLAPGAWVVGGAINNAGLTLQWVRQKWLNNVSFEQVERLVSATPAGSEGLFLLPFLTGERSPNWDPNLRASLYGLDFAHGSGHFARSAMEGVAYRIRSVFEPIMEIAGIIQSVRIGGGFMASPTWVQILTDVLNTPLDVLAEPQGSAYGAVLLGWVAIGKLNNLHASKTFSRVDRTIQPTLIDVEFYKQGYQKYQELYQRIYGKKGSC
ncbi:gluconokinase [Desulfitobacterium sp.]|uniref:gluconokinase n=1 Tax=Desulfitobacterium sp. TaxID=49981 RepID=UPI002C87F591|nr:gluconokinase [Desulfitobacterium sp.]HVJ47878.1 gluconokinase [Desulfitobacterium sp.]